MKTNDERSEEESRQSNANEERKEERMLIILIITEDDEQDLSRFSRLGSKLRTNHSPQSVHPSSSLNCRRLPVADHLQLKYSNPWKKGRKSVSLIRQEECRS
jgi:hypothetical protein